MATIVSDELTSQVTALYTGSDNFYALLMSDSGANYNASSTYLDVVDVELDPDIGAYARQEFSYGTSDINAYNAGVSVDSKRVTFTHGGTPITAWTVSHVAVVRAPASRSAVNQKPILANFDLDNTEVDAATDRVTVDAVDYSNFIDGDRIVLQPFQGAVLPAGLANATYYYVKKVGTNQLEFYSDEALSTIVDITGVSTGTAYIQNAIGTLFGVYELASPVSVAATQSVIYDIAINQGQ